MTQKFVICSKNYLEMSTNTPMLFLGPFEPQKGPKKIERSDWPSAFLAISRELKFSQTWILAGWSRIIPSNYICNIKKIVGAVFEKNGKNLIFRPFSAIFGRTGVFFKKSGSVSFHHLLFPNMMQKIRKILCWEVP